MNRTFMSVPIALVALVACGTAESTLGDGDDTLCHPEEEVPYDGIDQDCDGADLSDRDADGHDAEVVGGDDCDDEDMTIHPAADEVPYDGIDQDCDGADLWDGDGDGYDAEVVGGDDCDDEDDTVYPGAEEVPYDEHDQDCDGEDLHDVDGDGFAAEVVGGDDCDDSNAEVYPGAAEDHSDGVDQDCDGLVDEYLVCWDGSGDFQTIQSAVDALPTRSAVELCPGEYDELVSIDDKYFTIMGGGDSPDDVKITSSETSRLFYLTGSHLSVSVENVVLVCQVTDHGYKIVHSEDGGTLAFSRVGFRGADGGSCTIDAEGGNGAITIRDSLFDGYIWIYVVLSNVGSAGFELTVERSLFQGTADESAGVYLRAYQTSGYARLIFSNNLVVGYSTAMIYASADGSDGYVDMDISVEQNTFVGISDELAIYENLSRCEYSMYGNYCGDNEMTVYVQNNIFAESTARRTGVGGDGEWGGLMTINVFDETPVESVSVEAYYPNWQSGNLIWDVEGYLGSITYSYADWYCWEGCYFHSDDLSEYIEAGSLLADPEFEPIDGMGSYSFSGTSAAAGLGAFGGSDGDWWEDFSWELP